MYLNVVTHAEPLKSMIRLESLVNFLKENKITSCAVANSNLYQSVEYKQLFQKNGLKPVFALRVIVDFGNSNHLPLVVYAKSLEGYRNLIKISSGIMTRKPEVMPNNWLEPYSKDIIAVIPYGDSKWPNSHEIIQALKSIYQENIFIGISRTNGIAQSVEEKALELASHLAIKLVALHESYYINKEDAFAYEVLQAIDNGEKIVSYQKTQPLKQLPTPQEMTVLFKDKPLWLQHSQDILNSCNVEFEEYQAHMPDYPLINKETPRECLNRLAYEGLKLRMRGHIPDNYKERLDYELSVISKMGYDSYFLIVADYMAFAKREGILTGPGRGSSASSLVAYSLFITQVDPIKYNLLFERFLNPARVSLPDIDVDIIDKRRGEVIQYVKNKYGEDYAAQIITFGTLAMKGAGRDVGKVLNFSESDLKKISKLLDKSRQLTLMDAYQKSKDFKEFVESSNLNRLWFDTACRLEGLNRNTSTHAAGVVLTPRPLVNYTPIRKGNDGVYLTQWTMNEVEGEGILKVDLLGLSNLAMIENVCESLEKTYGVKPTLETIPFDDPNTFLLLQKGQTEGVFQLESEGMKKALMEIYPTSFNDIIAINALYRPGPMEFISTYAKRKQGIEAVTYPHPVIEPILKETYGIIIYQEQILRIAQVFAGFTLGEADLLRRAIGKKKREILEEQEVLFVRGAVNQGYETNTAKEIYALIVKFAEYGFPKSHSTAYSFISYQMAYLKANYPSHFYAAQLNKDIGNVDRLKRIFSEMKERNIKVLPIDITKSSLYNTSENSSVRLGILNIKGISSGANAYLNKNLNFDDLFEYAKDLGEHIDKNVMEKLIKVGAFDSCFGQSRNTLLESLASAIEYGSMDDAFLFGNEKPIYQLSQEKDDPYKMEQEVLGLALTGHPIEKVRSKEITATTNSIRVGDRVKMLLLIENIKVVQTKKKDEMAFLDSSDENGAISITVFPKQYSSVKSTLNVGNIYVVEGKVESKNKIITDKMSLFQ